MLSRICSTDERCTLPVAPRVGMKFHGRDCSMELTVLSFEHKQNSWDMVLLQRWPNDKKPLHPGVVKSTLTTLTALDFHQPKKGA